MIFFPFRFSPKARLRNAALIRQLPRRQEVSIQFETLSKPLLHEGFQTSFSLFLARLCLRVCANKRVFVAGTGYPSERGQRTQASRKHFGNSGRASYPKQDNVNNNVIWVVFSWTAISRCLVHGQRPVFCNLLAFDAGSIPWQATFLFGRKSIHKWLGEAVPKMPHMNRSLEKINLAPKSRPTLTLMWKSAHFLFSSSFSSLCVLP